MIINRLEILLNKVCEENSFEIRLADKQPKILFKYGLTLNFLNLLNEITEIKLIVSTYKNSSYYRNGWNQIIFLSL